MGCGCGKNKSQAQAQADIKQVEMLRSQMKSKSISPAPQIAKKVVEGLNRYKRCYTNEYCPEGEICVNGKCMKI